MAQYWEDWSGSTIEQAPSGWTMRGNASAVVEQDQHGPAGRCVTITVTGSGHKLLSMDAVDADPNRATVKIRALISIEGSYSTGVATYAGVAARAAAGSGSTVSYYTASFFQTPNSSGRAIFARSYINSAGGTLNSPDGTLSWNRQERYWIGLEITGSSIRATLATEADPDTLLADASGTSTELTAAGWVGINTVSSGPSPYKVYAVGIGTNGDEAPTSEPVVVKGVSLALYDGSTEQASITGITALWWDASAPTGAPVFETTTASTDASGVLELDIDSYTALDVTDTGFLLLYKADSAAEDDLIFAGRLAVQDIA